MLCTDKIMINWLIYGISHTPLPGARSQPLPLHRQTQQIRQQPIKNTLHRHHPLHLPRLLPDTHLRSPTLRRQRSLLLDESHPRLQSRHAHGTGTLPCGFGWVDSAVADWYWHHFFGPAQPAVGQIVRGFSEIAGDDNSFRLGIRLYLVRRIWPRIWNWYWQCDADNNPAHSFRLHRYSAWWYAAERLWVGLRYLTFYSCQYFGEYRVAIAESYHYQIGVWHWVRRIHYCAHPSIAHQAQ